MENRSLTYMLFSFQGRMSRSEYWLRYTIPLLLLYVVMFVLVIVQSLDRARDPCPEKSNTRGENEQHNQDEPDDRHGGEIRCVVRHRVGA